MKTSRLVLAGTILALVLGGFVALFASSSPDGLESVMLEGCRTDAAGEISGGECTLQQAGEHEIGGPLADYGIAAVGSETLGGSLAGIIGVLLVLGLATGLFRLLARGKGAGTESRGE